MTRTEVRTSVPIPIVTTFFRPLPSENTERMRIRQDTSHDWEALRKALEPETVALIPVSNGERRTEIGVVNVLSPYTQGHHVMLLDMTPAYRPTPTEIPDFEGDAMIDIVTQIVRFQQNMNGYNRVVSVGYNNSPLNYGEAEEKGGMQSFTTKWHLHVWSDGEFEEFTHDPNDPALPPNAKGFIKGDPLNRVGGALIEHVAQSFGRFIDLETTRVDRGGFSVKLRQDLLGALQSPRFFTGFMQPFHGRLEQISANILEAFTDFDYGTAKEMIRESFEDAAGKDHAYQNLQMGPALLDAAERRRNIGRLKYRKYPNKVVRALERISEIVKDKAEVDPGDQIRQGLGYALVISQHAEEPVAELRVRPAIRIGSSTGGVVETRGHVLTRLEEASGAADAVEKNHKNNQILREMLPPEINF